MRSSPSLRPGDKVQPPIAGAAHIDNATSAPLATLKRGLFERAKDPLRLPSPRLSTNDVADQIARGNYRAPFPKRPLDAQWRVDQLPLDSFRAKTPRMALHDCRDKCNVVASIASHHITPARVSAPHRGENR